VNRLVIGGVQLQQTRTGEPRSQSLVLVMVVAGMLWLRATGPAGMDACMGGLFRSMHVGMGSVMGLSLLGVVPGTLMKDSPCDRDWHPEARRRLCLWYSIFWEWGNGIKGNGKCQGEIRDETRLMGGSSDLAGRLFRSKASPFRSD
jgi:hypothetical protein